MTPREMAEKKEFDAFLDFLAGRNLKNAGDAAELKQALEEAAKEIAALKAQIPDTPAL